MKILSCVTDPIEIPYVVKAGADEVYFGVEWLYNYSNGGSFKSFDQLKKAVDICYRLKINFHLAVNAFETPCKEDDLKKLEKTIKMGVRSVIITDIGFGKYLKKTFPQISIHISSLVYVMNIECLEFIKKELGENFKRLIFPNQISYFEAHPLIGWCKKNNIETEVFFFRHFGCAYLNGYCYLHGDRYFDIDPTEEGGICKFGCGGFKAEITSCERKETKIINRIIDRINDRLNYGNIPRILNASSFFDYFVNGVQFVKYGSRTDPTAVKIKKIAFIKKTLRDIETLLSSYKADEAKKRFVKLMS